MKKIIFYSLFVVFGSSQSFGLSDLEISGEMDATATAWTLPTGERGNSSFAMPSLFLNVEVPLREENLLVLRFEGSEVNMVSTERFDLKVREAYSDVVSIFQGLHGLRFGLIPQTWQEAQYENWSYRFLGPSAWAITEKWNYLNYSDLGFSYMSQLPADLGEWALNVTNGEGTREKETGPRKEATLFFRLLPDEAWSASLAYVYGSYEQYGSDVAKKERIQALLTYRVDEEFIVGLEYLRSQDPADAITLYKMAEGVDVTSLTGKAVTGQAGSLFAVVSTGTRTELLLRLDYLNSVEGAPGKDLKMILTGLGYRMTDDIKLALSIDHTQYGEDFAAGVRDRSKLALAGQVLF